MTEIKQEKNVEIDVTKFVNVDDKPFDIYINGKLARHLEAGEIQIIPIWVAQVGAKHLVDKILQEKHNIKDTLHDTELRRSLFAKILPEMAEERKIKPLTDEEFRKKVLEEQEKQQKAIDALSGKKDEEKKEKDEHLEALNKRIADLEEQLKPKVAKKK